jgi:hypothetical protein
MNTDSNFSNEIKIGPGIYITKFNKSTADTRKEKRKYVFKSTGELINILETEFDEIAGQIERIQKANIEMENYSKDDPDLIQARLENIDLINIKIERLKEIQIELKVVCPTNPYVTTSINDYFKDKNEKSMKIDYDDITGNVHTINQSNNENEEIITQIEL